MMHDFSQVFQHDDCLDVIDGDVLNHEFDPDKTHVFIHGYNGCPHCRNMKSGTVPPVCDVKPDNVEFHFNDISSKAGVQMAQKLEYGGGPVPDPFNVCNVDEEGKWDCEKGDGPGYRPPQQYIDGLKEMGIDGWKL